MNRGSAIVALSPLTEHVSIYDMKVCIHDIYGNPHSLLKYSITKAETAHPARMRTSTIVGSCSQKSGKLEAVFQTGSFSGGVEILSGRPEVVSGRPEIKRDVLTTAAWR